MPRREPWHHRSPSALDDVDAARTELVRAAAEQVARTSYGKRVAFRAGRTRVLARAEDALSDALAAALVHWPQHGVPAAPEAWLITAARRKLIDAARASQTAHDAAEDVKRMIEELGQSEAATIPDRRLALMFACAHPAIDSSMRAPLILQTVLGLRAERIASAFLVKPSSMGQRLVRAKQKIRDAGIPFTVPEKAELRGRLDGVLEAIYAAYAEGWSDPTALDAQRRDLAEEAIWLGRVAVELVPEEPEALGLLALMLHTEARKAARRDAHGEFVPLDAQDVSVWDGRCIDEAECLLLAASRFKAPGRYQLEAAVQSAHAARRFSGHTDWAAILHLYEALYTITGSPVVAVNRAVALSHVETPAAGLAALEECSREKSIQQYQPYWAARAGLLACSGDYAAAHESYQRAIGLESDPAVRRFLQNRDAELKN
jgi:RNA polymerase sigma-70 factor (ECF subfamily)